MSKSTQDISTHNISKKLLNFKNHMVNLSQNIVMMSHLKVSIMTTILDKRDHQFLSWKKYSQVTMEISSSHKNHYISSLKEQYSLYLRGMIILWTTLRCLKEWMI